MTGQREPGRYNLHRLGWSAFEDLCMQVMRVVLGETCSRYRPGPDEGRDGWFQGNASDKLVAENGLTGSFVVQCKHTSDPATSVTKSTFSKEIKKAAELARREPFHYVAMVNGRLTAENERAIREAFEEVSGVGRCIVLGETWIEDSIDAHPRLLRLVPRLYGIGDVSQILSSVIQQQSAAVLEDLALSLETFVPTASYRKAEEALYKHGFVVLVGPPASGKTAIAANLCMVNVAQDADVRVLRIEDAVQFKETWSPADKNSIYWVDDVFGETTLDATRLREWSVALDKVEAARKRGARIIFCTRDYILGAAEQKLKKSRVDVINDARVRVDVTALSQDEKSDILYNHIKHGDLPKNRKTQFKPRLSSVARFPSFSPELARRLGSERFTKQLGHREGDLREFFDRPVEHLRDVLHGLSNPETAALALCLMANNAVPDPVQEDQLVGPVLRSYGVSLPELLVAFDTLEGSLVKRSRKETAQMWQVHHPSMLEALQRELAAKSSRMALYLQGARMAAILRDTTTVEPPEGSRLVFVPDTAYEHLVKRLVGATDGELEGVGAYLADRSSDRFLREIEGRSAELIDRCLAVVPEPDGSEVSAKLAVRLSQLEDEAMLDVHRRGIVEQALRECVGWSGWTGFLDVDGIYDAVPGIVEAIVRDEIERGFPSTEKLYEWHREDLSSASQIDSGQEELGIHKERLKRAIAARKLVGDTEQLDLAVAQYTDRLEEEREDVARGEARREYRAYYERKDSEARREERYEVERGRFSDVDE